MCIRDSQTLSDKEYQMLRTWALNIITELGIEGGCNCQFALKPEDVYKRQVQVPVVGLGGIATAGDALEFIMAGAAAVFCTLDEPTLMNSPLSSTRNRRA